MSQARGVRVLAADHYAIYRRGLKDTLEGESGIEVVAEAATGEETLEQVRASQPDVVLLDMGIQGTSGVDLIRQIKIEAPSAAIVILAQAENEEDVFAAIHAGVSGYLMKDETPESVVQAVISASEGRAYLPPSIAKKILDRVANAARGKGTIQAGERELSEREALILRFLAQGKRNREIGAALGISERTVSNHIAHIYSKLRVRDRAQAIAYALRKGLVTF